MNKTRSFVLAAGIMLAMAFTFSCSSGGGGDDGGNTPSSSSGGTQGGGGSSSSGNGSGGSTFDGTWNSADGEKMVLNNGTFTVSEDNVEVGKGTYTASGNNITMTISQVKGSALGDDVSDIGLSPTQWYTQQAFRTAIINYFVGLGASQSEAEALYDQEIAPLASAMFGTITGTYSGNTLTITAYGETSTYTKQGGTDNPGGGGILTVTGIPAEYNGKYIAGSLPFSFSNGVMVYACQSWAGQGLRWNLIQISGGRATIPLWLSRPDNFATATRYTGSVTETVYLYIHNGSTSDNFSVDYVEHKPKWDVRFTNGNASIAWDSADM